MVSTWVICTVFKFSILLNNLTILTSRPASRTGSLKSLVDCQIQWSTRPVSWIATRWWLPFYLIGNLNSRIPLGFLWTSAAYPTFPGILGRHQFPPGSVNWEYAVVCDWLHLCRAYPPDIHRILPIPASHANVAVINSWFTWWPQMFVKNYFKKNGKGVFWHLFKTVKLKFLM